MRGETVAEGIKRRMAEKETARRKWFRRTVTDIAIWGGAIGFTLMMLGVGAFLAASRGAGWSH